MSAKLTVKIGGSSSGTTMASPASHRIGRAVRPAGCELAEVDSGAFYPKTNDIGNRVEALQIFPANSIHQLVTRASAARGALEHDPSAHQVLNVTKSCVGRALG
jgi:hypothetical protein